MKPCLIYCFAQNQTINKNSTSEKDFFIILTGIHLFEQIIYTKKTAEKKKVLGVTNGQEITS